MSPNLCSKHRAALDTRHVCTGGEQERHRHWIENGDKRQGKQADRSLEVGGRRSHQLAEVSRGPHVRLGTPARGLNLGLLDLQATERRYLALTLCDDVGALAALLVGDRHRTHRAAKPCRFLNGRVDLGNTSIEVSDRLTLDTEASVDVGGSIRERELYYRHVIEVGARKEAE